MTARQGLIDNLLTSLVSPRQCRETSPVIDIVSGQPAAALLLECEAARRRERPGNTFHHDGLLRSVLLADANHTAIVVVKQDERIATVWPLRFERRYGLKLALDLTAPFAQYSDVIGEPLDEDAFRAVRIKLREGYGADAILCRGVRKDSGLAGVLTEENGSVVEEATAPFVNLKAFGTFEAYAGSFSKHTARTRRQRRKKLEALHGPLHFAVLEGKDGREAVAQALRWKRAWLSANGLSSRVVGVLDQQAILLGAVESPAAHVSVLSAQGRPISVELGFSCAGHYASYLGAFDPELAAYSPGQEQMLLTIEWCFAQGFARYDLLPPRDAYKLHWTRQLEEEHVSDHCVALSGAGAIYALARRHARAPIKRSILSLPARLRVAARRYGPAVAGLGATVATIGIMAD